MTGRAVLYHIGHPKTGTTAIQGFLTENRDALRAAGICYPDCGYIRHNQHALNPAFLDPGNVAIHTVNRMGYDAGTARRRSLKEWQGLYAQLRDPALHRVLMSSESLFRVWTPEEVSRFTDLMAPLTADIRFLAYLRSPVTWYVSRLQQRLKASRVIRPPSMRPRSPMLDSLSDHFGREALELRIFDRTRLRGGDIVADYMDAAGIAPDLPGLTRAEASKNTTLSAEAMALLADRGPEKKATTRFAVKRQNTLLRAVAAADRAIPGFRRPALREEARAALIHGATDLEVLRDRYGIVFGDIDYAEIGRGPAPDPGRFKRIADYCAVDPERLAEMAARVDRSQKGILKYLRHR